MPCRYYLRLRIEPERFQEGVEFWGFYEIRNVAGAAENKNCRKDGSKMYYHPDGGKVVYKAKGTTNNNNRCRLNDVPSVLLSDVED